MVITTRDKLIDALANTSSRIVIDKASVANAVAGAYYSLWRATGQPGQGAIPTAAALCTSATVGAMGFTNQTAPATSYLAWLAMNCSNAAVTMEIHDRIAHMGGLNATLLTSQTVALNLHSSGLNPPAARLGDANFSDVQWWAEWYTDTGATASNATINVTYNDATTGALTLLAIGGTVRASRKINLNVLVPAAKAGFFIRSIDSVILSASTATAGNFGFTATRLRTVSPLHVANKGEVYDWAQIGLAEVPNDACLELIQLCSTTTTGTVRGGGKIAHG
jgi:hypothetical protein